MNEELLQFIWKFGLFKSYKIYGEVDEIFEILNRGVQNKNAGPDFFGARIKFGTTIWAGNVEIHLKASDWYTHGHHTDKAYNNVILQVVTEFDKEVETQNGRTIPVLEIEIDKSLEKKHLEFKKNLKWIPCQQDIKNVDDFKLKLWLGNILIERLGEKSELIKNLLIQNKNNWEETFYQLLARNFGFKVNAEPFEWLAKSLPVKYLAKHKNNSNQIEALFFGQAGFLEERLEDEYYQSLKKEYEFLKAKYQLTPLEKYLWKFLRLRPFNFPTLRISQFAMLTGKSNSLFSNVIDCGNLQEIKNLFQCGTSDYWDEHFIFGKKVPLKKKVLGNESINNILINTVIPVIFVYGAETGNEKLKEKSLNYLEELKPEKNNIISNWKETGIKVESAFYSQALLQLKSAYCNATRCLECGVGIEILKNQYSNKSMED